MAKARKTVAPKTTKCPAARLAREYTKTIEVSHALTDLLREIADRKKREFPGMTLDQAVQEAESETSYGERSESISQCLTDIERYASHLEAQSFEGAMFQIALAIEYAASEQDCGQTMQERQAAGRALRNLLSAYKLLEKHSGANPDSLISQHCVSLFEREETFSSAA